MATKKSTAKKQPKAKRESVASLADRLHMDLIGVQATVITTRIAIDDCRPNSILHAAATNLLRGAINPMEKLLEELAVIRG